MTHATGKPHPKGGGVPLCGSPKRACTSTTYADCLRCCAILRATATAKRAKEDR